MEKHITPKDNGKQIRFRADFAKAYSTLATHDAFTSERAMRVNFGPIGHVEMDIFYKGKELWTHTCIVTTEDESICRREIHNNLILDD